jgi:acetyl-CoA carboxylase biotin carboxyl carrier protein
MLARTREAYMSERARGQAKESSNVATDVKAHITGTVWKIEAQAGVQVNEGDTVIILESMKMEMPVEAPVAGKIREIKIKEGEAVDEGKVLAVIDES